MMTAPHIRAWQGSAARGSPRLVLVCLAAHADWQGNVSMPLRTIAAFCRLSKTAAADAIKALDDCGDIAIVHAGGGKGSPARYRVMPDGHKAPSAPAPQVDTSPEPPTQPPPPPRLCKEPLGDLTPAPAKPAPAPLSGWQPDTWPEALPRNDVGRVLRAARAEVDPMTPFYWHQREHRIDLETLAADAGGIEPLIEALLQRPAAGPIRRLSQLSDSAGGSGK